MTIAVCLKCGSMKHGVLTPCRNCGHTPQEVEDKARHMMISDHHFSHADLEGFSTRIQNGQPLHFDPKQVEQFVAVLNITETEGKYVGLFLLGFFAFIAFVLGGAIYLFVWMLLR